MTDQERAAALAALEAYEAWEADVILNGDWSGETPALTQEQVDRLVAIQQLRNVALDRLRLITEQATPSPVKDDLRNRVMRAVLTHVRDHASFGTVVNAALSSLRPGDEINGCVLMPHEPTKAMGDAGSESHTLISWGMAGDCYRAMVRAALAAEEITQ